MKTLNTVLVLGSFVVGACSDSGNDPSPPNDAGPAFTCTPTSPSTSDEFAQQRDPSSDSVALAEAIAQRFMSLQEPEDITWDWGEATFILSLVDLYRVTANTTYRDYYQRWIDYYIDVGYDYLIVSSDRCPPALAALALYQENCQEPYRAVVTEVLHYLYEKAARTPQGGINHLGTIAIFEPTLWVDSLFMFGNVLTRWGAYADDTQALDEYSTQFGIFADLLQDSSGLFIHSYNWQLDHEDLHWARGNGWVTAASYEYLRVRKQRNETDEAVRSAMQLQVDAVINTQDPATGLWWTIMDRPDEIYLETSATALFALGMARGYRDGLLTDAVLPVIEKAMQGVKSKITTNGQGQPVVTEVSGPTTVGTFNDYAAVELGEDIHYGVGAVILALLETSGLDLSSSP